MGIVNQEQGIQKHRQLNFFLNENKKEIVELNKSFFRLFNKVGEELHDGNIQNALLMYIVISFFQHSQMQKEDKLKVMQGVEMAIKNGKA